MKRLRTGVVCLSGVIVAAGMAMAKPRVPVTPGKGRPIPSQPDGGMARSQPGIPAMPPVPKQPMQFSEWSRLKERGTPDDAKRLYTVIYEGGPRDPNHFYAYGFDVQRRRNVFFVTGDLKELPKFRSMLPPPPPPPPLAPRAPGEQPRSGSPDAGTYTPPATQTISQLPGGDPPPPPPNIHEDPNNIWLPYAYRAWTGSFEMSRLSSVNIGSKSGPLKTAPTP